MSRQILLPSDKHPITIEPTAGHVVARVGDIVVADSRNALTLQEADYPAVQYIPVADVNTTVLESTDTNTWCPFKGEASYYSVHHPSGETVNDVIWYYPEPHEAVAQIAGH